MKKRIIDLSVPIQDGMVTHKLFSSPMITKSLTHEKDQGLGVPGDSLTFQTNVIATLDHVGTHIDSQLHFNPKGAPVDEIPIGDCIGKAVCFDFTHIPDLGEIDVADLKEAERKTGIKVDGHIVLFNTGLHKRHYHYPADRERMSCWTNPGITAEATQWLYDRGSKLHGVEGPSTDRPSDNLFPQHRKCRDLGISHIEWLTNLEELVGKEFEFFAVPLRLTGCSGSPVRAFAILEE